MAFDNVNETYFKNLYDQAQELLHERQINLAVKMLEELDAKGYSEGSCLLARVFRGGWGTEPDFERAFMLYSKAFAMGYAPAEVGIADCYYLGLGVRLNREKAIEIYRRHAELGNNDAKYQLAYAYSNGLGVEKDPGKSVEMFTELVDLGYAKAYYNLGLQYYNGTAVEYSHEKAMELYNKAIEAGYPEGYYGIAWTYYQGKGNEKDHKKAFEYFMLAVDENYPAAMNSIAYMYTNGEGVERDYAKALEFTKRAMKHMNSRAMYDYAYAYYMGYGVDKDYDTALEYLRMSEEYGCNRVYATLGHAYYHGNGVEKNMERSLEYYTFAAEKAENKNVLYFLGTAHINGSAPASRKNLKLGYDYLLRASELGDERSKSYLESQLKDGLLDKIANEDKLAESLRLAEEGDPEALGFLAAHYSYGVSSLERRFDEAAEYARRALDKAPDNAEALTALAYAHIEAFGASVEQLNESVMLFDRAMSLDFEKAYELFYQAFYHGKYDQRQYKKDGEWVNVYTDEAIKKAEILAIRASNRKRREDVDKYRSEHPTEGDFHIEGTILKKYLGFSQIVKIPEEITEIGNSAFESCYCVRQIIFPRELNIIGYRGFHDCRLIRSINLPATLEIIGKEAFASTNLEELICPDGLKVIEELAFENCSLLKKITVSESIESIGQCAFDATAFMDDYKSGEPKYIPSKTNPKKLLYMAEEYEGESYEIESGVEVIGAFVLSEANQVKTVSFPKSITRISPYAFAESSLTEVKLPAIEEIPDHAFMSCNDLRKVTFSKKTKYIRNSAFIYCDELKSIKLPPNIKEIEENAFGYCELKTVTLPRGFEFPSVATGLDDIYEDIKFTYYDPEENSDNGQKQAKKPNEKHAEQAKAAPVSKYPPEFEVVLNAKIAYLDKNGVWHERTGDRIVGYKGNSGNLIIPQGIMDIGPSVFAYRSEIRNITFPSSLIRIEHSAFSHCTGLTEVRIPATVKDIGGQIFKNTNISRVYVSKATYCSPDAFKGLGFFKVKKY